MEWRPDPDAVPASSPEAAAYDAEVSRLAREAIEPLGVEAYGDDRGQKIAVYAPSGAKDLPVLLFFHGGAWISGHLGWLAFMARAVTSLPAVFVAASYRLAPRCRWPAQLEDAGAAFDHIVDRAVQWGGDPNRVAVGGHSAGGHLAALLALRSPGRTIRACLPVSSSFDLRYGNVPLESDAGRVYRYLFAERAQDTDASPIAFVRPGAPPFHIEWGEHDFQRVASSGPRMVDALRAAGVGVTSRVRQRAGHFDTHLALRSGADQWYGRVADLLAPEQITIPAGTAA